MTTNGMLRCYQHASGWFRPCAGIHTGSGDRSSNTRQSWDRHMSMARGSGWFLVFKPRPVRGGR